MAGVAEFAVEAIVRQCAENGVAVSETLAAFVARTVVNENATQFRMDVEMTEEDQREMVSIAVDRLLQQDSPSIETVKMQVAFDTAYIQHENALDKALSVTRTPFDFARTP